MFVCIQERQSSSTNMRQMAAAAAKAAAAAAEAYEDTVMPAVTKARYADQDMCYINRRPSRKHSTHHQNMDNNNTTGSVGPQQLPARQMSMHPDATPR